MSAEPSYVLSGEHDPHQWSKWRRWMIIFVVWNSIAPVDLALTFYVKGPIVSAGDTC
jgi:hypothetical protein